MYFCCCIASMAYIHLRIQILLVSMKNKSLGFTIMKLKERSLAPPEWYSAGPIGALFDQRLVEFASRPGVDGLPTVFAVVLQAGYIGTEEGGKLSPTTCTLAFITHLVVQNIWLYLNLKGQCSHQINAHLYYTMDFISKNIYVYTYINSIHTLLLYIPFYQYRHVVIEQIGH